MAEQNEATTRLIKNPKRVAAVKANAEKRRLAQEAADMNLLEPRRPEGRRPENNTPLTNAINLLETKSFNTIPVIRNFFKSMAANCCHSGHALFWITAVEDLDDEKLLKWYIKFENYKKENERMLPILGLEEFHMFCARLAK